MRAIRGEGLQVITGCDQFEEPDSCTTTTFEVFHQFKVGVPFKVVLELEMGFKSVAKVFRHGTRKRKS